MGYGRQLKKILNVVPYRYQLQGVRFIAANNGRALLCDDMGLGKSLQALSWLMLRPDLRPALIVCPAHLKWTWGREFSKLAGEKNVEILEGMTPYEISFPIAVINYEILQHWTAAINKWNPKAIVFDEFQYIANWQAKRTRASFKIAKGRESIVGLSGTPIENRPSEFWPILNIVFPEEFESRLTYFFRYCDPKRGYGGRWDFRGSSNLKELHRRIRPLMKRRLKKQVLKWLPDKRRIPIVVDIDNREEYEDARNDILEWIKREEGEAASKKASGALALVRTGKLKQLAAKGKLKNAVRWIKDYLATGKKLIVFCVHNKIVHALAQSFKKQCVTVTGKETSKVKADNVERFQTDDSVRLLIGHLKAAGSGFTMTAAHGVLMLELGWNFAKHEQAEDRAYRIGQEKKVEVYYMVGLNTVEERLLEIILAKQGNVEIILEGETDDSEGSMIDLIKEILE